MSDGELEGGCPVQCEWAYLKPILGTSIAHQQVFIKRATKCHTERKMNVIPTADTRFVNDGSCGMKKVSGELSFWCVDHGSKRRKCVMQ